MVDDDEDIRDLGAATVSALLYATHPGQAQRRVLMPPLACQVLCAHLVRKHRTSGKLLVEAVDRLVRQTSTAQNPWQSVGDSLRTELSIEMSLFDEEKQNQYIDDVKEADIWSQVLKHISIEACPQNVIDMISRWTMEGLDALIAATKADADGPLGWTSKADIFALGWRVFCAADVLLEWRMKSRTIKVRASTIRLKLGLLAVEGEKQDLHGLWLGKIERVMTGSVVKRLGRVGSVLESMPVHAK